MSATHFSGPVVSTGGFTGDVTGDVTGAVTGGTVRLVESISGDETITAADSGKMFVDVKGSATTTFTLPVAAAGLTYTFVCGDADGEILIDPQTGDAIVTKADPTGASVAPAAGTGIKNTAATNIVGDHITLVALDATTWYTVAQGGTWASQ